MSIPCTPSPTPAPTGAPTAAPTAAPTTLPPTSAPTNAPTPAPTTSASTAAPSISHFILEECTPAPTSAPTPAPTTSASTAAPSISHFVLEECTPAPTNAPTPAPTTYSQLSCTSILANSEVGITLRDGAPLSAANTLFIGKPSHITLTKSQLDQLQTGTFEWEPRLGNQVKFTSFTSAVSSGIILVNKLNTVSHSNYEGTYISISDNTKLDATDTNNKITKIQSFKDSTYNEDEVASSTITVPITSDSRKSNKGSISEVVKKLSDSTINTKDYNDTLAIGVFKLNQSPGAPDVSKLDVGLIESHIGSLDYYKEKYTPDGGEATSSYLETEINNNSQVVRAYINPNISKIGGSWSDIHNQPSKYVRCITTDPGYIDREEEVRLQCYYSNIHLHTNTISSANVLSNVSTFAEKVDYNSKVIGDLPDKLEEAFKRVSNSEEFPIDIVIDSGLSTIYTGSEGGTSYYNDEKYIDLEELYTTDDQATSTVAANHNTITNAFLNFVNDRKDLMFISDPLKHIFVQGSNIKTLDDNNKNFNQHIYWPLKHLYKNVNSSYAAVYSTWYSVYDEAANKQSWMPFSGLAAAKIIQSEQLTYPWTPVGGFTRGSLNINNIAFAPTRDQSGTLYTININPVEFYPNDGFNIFGQKTMQKKPSAFDRINVRRLFLYAEKAVKEALKYFVFQQNTLRVRRQIVSLLEPFFEFIKETNPQGIYDYQIVCDKSNNTPETIDNNELIVDILLQPVKAAEFIRVNFIATRTGTNFNELI